MTLKVPLGYLTSMCDSCLVMVELVEQLLKFLGTGGPHIGPRISHSQDSYFKMWNLLGTFEPSSQEFTRAPAQHRKIKSKNDSIKANM